MVTLTPAAAWAISVGLHKPFNGAHPRAALYRVPAFRDNLLPSSGANYSNRCNSAACWCNLAVKNTRQNPCSTIYQWSKVEGFGLQGSFFLHQPSVTWVIFSLYVIAIHNHQAMENRLARAQVIPLPRQLLMPGSSCCHQLLSPPVPSHVACDNNRLQGFRNSNSFFVSR